MRDGLDRQYIIEQAEGRLVYTTKLFSLGQVSDEGGGDTLLLTLFCYVSVIEALLGVAIADVVGSFGERIKVGDRYINARKIGLTEEGEDLFLCVRKDEMKKVDQINLQTLIDIAYQKKIITKSESEVLHRLRDMRNGVHLMNIGAQSVVVLLRYPPDAAPHTSCKFPQTGMGATVAVNSPLRAQTVPTTVQPPYRSVQTEV